MKKVKTSLFGALTIAGLLFMSGCSKDGATGPAGPIGNANVQTLAFSIPSSNWTVNPNYFWEIDAVYQSTDFDFNGAVLCYYSVDNNTWQLLPWTSDGNSPYFEMLFSYNQQTGLFGLEWTNITPGSNAVPAPPATSYFKIVGIPPALKAAHPNVNYKTYNEVKQAFNLKN